MVEGGTSQISLVIVRRIRVEPCSSVCLSPHFGGLVLTFAIREDWKRKRERILKTLVASAFELVSLLFLFLADLAL